MRSLIIGFVVFLAACNQGTNNVPYSDPELVAKVDSLTKALADATHAQAEQAQKLQLFVNLNQSAETRNFRTFDIPVDFGPCSDPGIKVGSTGKSGLDDQTQIFKQTPSATCPGVYAEYDVQTGNLHVESRIYYASLDCTGQAYEWDAGGFGMDRQKLEVGASFISPNFEGQMWVAPGTQPIMVQVGSVFIIEDGGCVPDGDNQPMWAAVQTNTATSGVPLSLGAYQLSGL